MIEHTCAQCLLLLSPASFSTPLDPIIFYGYNPLRIGKARLRSDLGDFDLWVLRDLYGMSDMAQNDFAILSLGYHLLPMYGGVHTVFIK